MLPFAVLPKSRFPAPFLRCFPALVRRMRHFCREVGGILRLGADRPDGVGSELDRPVHRPLADARLHSLQVVIGLCRRKETAALKIKAAVSNGHENMSALRRLSLIHILSVRRLTLQKRI